MAAQTWGAYTALWLGTIALVLLCHYLIGSRRKLNLPPGPKPWPIIGNLDIVRPLPHRSFHELSKKYGPIMTLWYGSVPVVVGSSVEMARLLLKTHDAILAGRPIVTAGKFFSHDYSGILWSQYGPYFAQVRKICLTKLLNSKRLESYQYIRVEELNSLLKAIFKQCSSGKPITCKDHLFTMSVNTISRMAFGKKYMKEREGSVFTINEFLEMLDEFFFLNGALYLGDWIPLFKHIDVQGYVKRMKVLAKRFDRLMEEVMDEHNARREREKENWVAKDVVDVLLELSEDPKLDIKLGRNEIIGITHDLIIGGIETSPITLEWALSELLRHPIVIAKATEELDHVIGRQRWVLEQDMHNLPYICAIVKETMRLHSVAPTLTPRFLKEDVQIQGYDIPKGTVMFVNTFTSQRDPNVYERPEEFLPERFIEKNLDVKGQHFQLLPFGSGRRMCPGFSLGLKVVEMTLANLLHGFTWKLPENIMPKDLNMEEKFGLTIHKKIPLVVCVEPRLAPHMYHAI